MKHGANHPDMEPPEIGEELIARNGLGHDPKCCTYGCRGECRKDHAAEMDDDQS